MSAEYYKMVVALELSLEHSYRDASNKLPLAEVFVEPVAPHILGLVF